MTTFRHLVAIVGILSFLFGGCSKPSAPQSPVNSEAPVLKVAVYAGGRLTGDGKASTVQSLRSVSEERGVVWYYRETGRQEPLPIATEVMQAVIEARLPIRLSSRPDYSDSIGCDGKPIAQ